MAGRPPKPLEQHIREGTYRKDRHGSTALVVTTPGYGIAHLGAPTHLTKFQQDVWMELARLLESIVRESDVPMVEMAAVAYASYRDAQNQLNREGLTFIDDKGNVKEQPLVRITQRYQKLFMDLSARLGLSPADRTRLGINLGNLAKSKSELMIEQYGEDDTESGPPEEEDSRTTFIPDAGQERDVLMDGELGYDSIEP